jgi:hypothetical protein
MLNMIRAQSSLKQLLPNEARKIDKAQAFAAGDMRIAFRTTSGKNAGRAIVYGKASWADAWSDEGHHVCRVPTHPGPSLDGPGSDPGS